MRSVAERLMDRKGRTFARALGALVVAGGLSACASALGSSSGTYVGARGSGPMTVHVDLSSRHLTVERGGSVVATYEVAVGQDALPTPQGSYTIEKIIWNPDWVPPNADWAKDKEPQEPGAAANPMKVIKIFFKEPDYYIHGTANTASLGSAESHGCLRMSPADAATLGRMLMENGGQPRDESWFSRVMRDHSQTETVILPNPIPITISN